MAMSFDPDEVDVSGALQFVVVWRKGKRLDGAQIAVGGAVAEYLQGACRHTLESISQLEHVKYSPDMQLEPEECAIISDAALIKSSAVGALLFCNVTLPLISGRDIGRRTVILYAVLVGVGERCRAFIRKRNPQLNVKPGGLLTALGDTLTGLEYPVLELEDMFDLIASPAGVIVLRQNVFEVLFKDAAVLQERIPDWVRDITGRLPMDEALAERLTAKCQRDTRFRRRLCSIHERGHLAHVTMESLRQHIQMMGLAEEAFIKNGRLVVSDEHLSDLMYLLNEDLFTGGLTSSRFRSSRKSPR